MIGVPLAKIDTETGDTICPECGHRAWEKYDAHGERITNYYAEHYAEKHPRGPAHQADLFAEAPKAPRVATPIRWKFEPAALHRCEDVAPPYFAADGTRLTDCCRAMPTFHDEILCCKVCWSEVPSNQGDGI